MSEKPAGWYDDGSGRQRYWDGAAWTDHFADEQVRTVETVVAKESVAAPVGGSFWRGDTFRIVGLICGYVHLVGLLLNMFNGALEIILLELLIVIPALIVLHKRIKPAAIVLWALVVVAQVVLGNPLYRLVTILAAVVALVSAVKIDDSVARERARQRQEAQAAAQHEQRVAQINEWEAAYRAAHNGEVPPAGFMPPVAFSPTQFDRTNTMAILSLIFGWSTGILGVIFGHIALKQIAETGERGRGLAIAGLVLGYIALAGVAIIAIYWIVVLNTVL